MMPATGRELQRVGTCTLRAAIEAANGSPGSTIAFNITGGGVQTISPVSELPVITQRLTIDGTTQPGYSGSPLIEIKGNNFAPGQAIDGMKIRASNCVVRGLAINEFPHAANGDGSFIGGNGLTLESTTNSPNNDHNMVEGNFLGTDPTGTLDKGNASTGLNVFDSDNDTIGGTAAFAGNVISGNGNQNEQGAGVQVVNGNNDVFQGNYIGTNAASTAKLGNSTGFLLSGSNNAIGGEAAGSGNVISGNGELQPGEPDRCDGYGLSEALLFAQGDLTNLTFNNLLQGNKIGTNAAGTVGLGNCSTGILTNPISRMVVASIMTSGRNIISGNGNVSIDIAGNFNHSLGLPPGGFTAISGNNIGTDITGTVAIPNDNRNGCVGHLSPRGRHQCTSERGCLVNFGAPGGTTPGGACTGYCNLISGNGEGVGTILRETFDGFFGVFDNYFGTDINGTAAVPNKFPIISLHGTTAVGIVGANRQGP